MDEESKKVLRKATLGRRRKLAETPEIMSERNMTPEQIREFNAFSDGYNKRAEELEKTLDGETVPADPEINAMSVLVGDKRVLVQVDVAALDATVTPDENTTDAGAPDTSQEEQLQGELQNEAGVQTGGDTSVRNASVAGEPSTEVPSDKGDVQPEGEVLPE